MHRDRDMQVVRMAANEVVSITVMRCRLLGEKRCLGRRRQISAGCRGVRVRCNGDANQTREKTVLSCRSMVDD